MIWLKTFFNNKFLSLWKYSKNDGAVYILVKERFINSKKQQWHIIDIDFDYTVFSNYLGNWQKMHSDRSIPFVRKQAKR